MNHSLCDDHVSVQLSSKGDAIEVVLVKGPELEELTLFTFPIREFTGLSTQRAAAFIGARVLAALGHFAGDHLREVGYSALSEQGEHVIAVQRLEAASSSDPQEMFGLALDKIVESVTALDLQLLEDAERHLRRAAEMGLDRAQRFLDVVWPVEKEERIRAIQHGKLRDGKKDS